mmetsp:Transcript_16471/g.33614  ORF Transcript_16471/g.33614 Transcript_16471/m.33614 type:complete len:84 (-) Transcript_16471:1390-1641(-)
MVMVLDGGSCFRVVLTAPDLTRVVHLAWESVVYPFFRCLFMRNEETLRLRTASYEVSLLDLKQLDKTKGIRYLATFRGRQSPG